MEKKMSVAVVALLALPACVQTPAPKKAATTPLGADVYVENETQHKCVVHSTPQCKAVSKGVMKKPTREAKELYHDSERGWYNWIMLCTKCVSDSDIRAF